MTLWAVSGKVSHFSALKACVRRVSGSGGISLKVVLGSIALIAVGVPLSMKVVALIVFLAVVVSLSTVWCSVLVDVHGDWSVVHPLLGI